VLDGEQLLAFHLTDCLLHQLVHCLAACWIERELICAQTHHNRANQGVRSIRRFTTAALEIGF
jgi:hypothetical protein